jgi:5-methyltetrahydrofolate--homocysteine methyltransferase
MTRTVIESKTKTVIIGFDEPFCVIGERIRHQGRPRTGRLRRHGP